jgi:hypothetical protein
MGEIEIQGPQTVGHLVETNGLTAAGTTAMDPAATVNALQLLLNKGANLQQVWGESR